MKFLFRFFFWYFLLFFLDSFGQFFLGDFFFFFLYVWIWSFDFCSELILFDCGINFFGFRFPNSFFLLDFPSGWEKTKEMKKKKKNEERKKGLQFFWILKEWEKKLIDETHLEFKKRGRGLWGIFWRKMKKKKGKKVLELRKLEI